MKDATCIYNNMKQIWKLADASYIPDYIEGVLYAPGHYFNFL